MNDTDRLAQLIHEAREMGIEVLPPDVNVSQKEFTVEKGKIVFGLLGIKNVGSGGGGRHHRREGERAGPSRASWTSSQRIDSHEVNRKVAESLIITGAFDRLGETRATLHAQHGTGDGAVRQGPGGEAVRAGVPLRGRRGRARGGHRAGAPAGAGRPRSSSSRRR